jgi:HlyD family secretion protein
MRWMKILLLAGLMILMIGSLSCSQTNAPKASPQLPPVAAQPADTKIHGTGKITADSDALPAFKSGGKVVSVFIKEGGNVRKGDKLAALDTTDLEMALSQAQLAESQCQFNISQAQVSVSQAQVAKTQAAAALTLAQFALEKTRAVSDIKDSIMDDQLAINTAQLNMNTAQAIGDSASVSALNQNLIAYQRDLRFQQKKLSDLLSQDPYTTTDAAIYINGQKYDRMIVEDVRAKTQQIESAQAALDQTDKNLNQAQLNIDLSQKNLAQAQKSVQYYQKQITDCTLQAPFNGLIVGLYIQVGDIIPQPSVNVKSIARIVDLASFQVTAEIDEEDIARVKTGQTADVTLKALPGVHLSGKVTEIGSVPKVKLSGEVDYEVTIDIQDSLSPILKIGMSTDVDILP